MIVFGTAVTDAQLYDRCAAPGIKRASEPDSVIYKHHTAGSVFRNYNLLLDKAAQHDELEALVLIHQDAELVDADFPDKVRQALSDPDVAIVGCAGAVGVRSIAWWQGAVSWAGLTHRYPEFGGGDFPAISWRRTTVPSYAEPGEVDSVDGFVLVMSPWAVRELRFDESLGKLHGYDFDICMQVKAAGKKVVTADFRAIHHHSLELIKDPEVWIQTYIRLTEKWEHLFGESGADPRQAALRAEAEAACARAIMVSHQMRESAAKRQLERLERELEAVKGQLSSARRELELAREQPGEAAEPATATNGDNPASAPAPGGGKLAAIDHAVDELGVESFASLEIGQMFGQYAFYAAGKPKVRSGALIDVGAGLTGDFLLNAIDQAAERPDMRILDGGFADPEMVSEIGEVDALLLLDVLVRMVDPDWDQLLELYARSVGTCFVIANPMWENGGQTVRLIELGREQYLAAVPSWQSHIQIFDQLDDWNPAQHRRFRDGTDVWQWGVTDQDLKAKMEELGFSAGREWTLNRPPDTEGFVNKAYVFTRT